MRLRALCFSFLLATAAPAGAATVVFSNFGAGDGFDSSGFTSDFTFDFAQSFSVSGGDIDLLSIEVALLNLNTNLDNEVDIILREDSGGGLPGIPLETIHLSGAMTTGPATLGSLGSIVTATSVAKPTLMDGSVYWVEVSAGPPNDFSEVRWHTTGVNPTPGAFEVGDIVWGNLGLSSLSLRVNGGVEDAPRPPVDPIPEPSAALIFATGALLLRATRRTR